ncbi:hypothetical protein OG921_08855 [Aldersonia sp. NBC_00410]|uniref:hypothetical protein n=1 Tax=Aldersonia sp. NBC_00410 TaxID=2975954 RepID=UPI00225A7CFD|nr:hypothetical protein [Aldersonia sp. NBC_00410]MCX5043277.1 hypothetical protein [Aldersonia sp. NBC_00410]
MTRVVVGSVVLLVLLEVALVAGPLREWLLLACAGVLAIALWGVLSRALKPAPPGPTTPADTTPDDALRRWRERTRMQLAWADGTRGDWDRHVRPMVARDFQLALGRRFDGSTAGLDAAGNVMFGAELWTWVDPSGVRGAERDRPGPGREVLGEILDRLERM